MKRLKYFKLHDKNSKKSVVVLNFIHYPSTLLKGKFSSIHSILYCYNVGNICKRTMFILSLRYTFFSFFYAAKKVYFCNFVSSAHFILHHPAVLLKNKIYSILRKSVNFINPLTVTHSFEH